MMGISVAHRTPRTDWKNVTPQELFKMHLSAKLFNFGFVDETERFDFLKFVVQNKFLVFVGCKEVRGTLAKYEALENFAFSTTQAVLAGHRQWLTISAGDFIELTEQFLDYNSVKSDGSSTYKIWTDVSPEESDIFYAR